MSYEIVEQVDSFADVLQKIADLGADGGKTGIIVFGPESSLKDVIYNRILLNSGRIFGKEVQRQEHSNTWSRIELVQVESGIIVKLNGDASIAYGERHRIVLGLKNSGMDHIVGIYVKGDRSRESFTEERPSITKRPPTADGLTFLVTISTTNPSPLT